MRRKKFQFVRWKKFRSQLRNALFFFSAVGTVNTILNAIKNVIKIYKYINMSERHGTSLKVCFYILREVLYPLKITLTPGTLHN
jgi:hypothetical protein